MGLFPVFFRRPNGLDMVSSTSESILSPPDCIGQKDTRYQWRMSCSTTLAMGSSSRTAPGLLPVLRSLNPPNGESLLPPPWLPPRGPPDFFLRTSGCGEGDMKSTKVVSAVIDVVESMSVKLPQCLWDGKRTHPCGSSVIIILLLRRRSLLSSLFTRGNEVFLTRKALQSDQPYIAIYP